MTAVPDHDSQPDNAPLAGMTAFVTGATGFIGGALAHRLAADGANVRALIRSPHKEAFLRSSPHFDARIQPMYGDLSDAKAITRAMQGCSHVFHVAAALGGPLDRQRRTNVEGTRHVMQAAIHHRVTHVSHISTIAVYGFGARGDITERTPPAPGHDPYAISKLEAERMVRMLADHNNLPHTIIRPGGVYGPRSGYWTGKLARLALRRVIPLPHAGRGTIPVIYIDDLIDLIVQAACHPDASGQVFNATPTPAPTIREYLDGYAAQAGTSIRWLPLPAAPVTLAAHVLAALARPQTRRKELGQIAGMIARRVTYRNDHARQVLGWQPRVDLAAGIARSADWLRAHGGWP